MSPDAGFAVTRGLRTSDIFRLSLVADPRLSPDHRQVAYVRGRLDGSADRVTEQVVVTALETGGEWRPAPDGYRARCPRWSADGRLAFLCDATGVMRPWLWAPGAPARPVPMAEGAVVDLDWSPDGRALAVIRVTRSVPGGEADATLGDAPFRADGQQGLVMERRSLHVVPADGRPLPGEGLPDLRIDAALPRWSPDGTRLAFVSGAQLRIVSLGERRTGAGARTWLAPAPGPVLAFAWGPSGADIAYLAPRGPEEADVDPRLFRWAVDGASGPDELAAGWDRALGTTVRADDGRGTGPPELAWSPATGQIYLTVADGGQGRIGWVDPADGAYGYLPGRDRACFDPSLDVSGRVIAFVASSPAEPGDVYLADIHPAGASGERRVTNANPWLGTVRLAATRQVTARDPGCVPVEGWLTAFDDEPDADRGGRPLVVSVHGGPHYPVGWRFSFEAQRLATLGYAVLAGNPPGSGGYGRAFATMIRGAWGTADWAGMDRLIEAAASKPGVDASRAAITGVSYGGYLAMFAITRSSRFLAAISENGISNLLAEWGAEQDGGAWLSGELDGPPWDNPQAYVASSPIVAADRIRTPLLLIHAEFDRNCPMGQSEQMFAALRGLHRTVELCVIKGEGHLMNLAGRPSRRVARMQATDRWLDRYLRRPEKG